MAKAKRSKKFNKDFYLIYALDSALTTQEANSKIVDEFLGLCKASDDDRTQGSSRKRAEALPKKSPQAEFVRTKYNSVHHSQIAPNPHYA